MENLEINLREIPSLLTDYDIVNGIAGIIWQTAELDKEATISLDSVYNMAGLILGYIRSYDTEIKGHE